MADSAFKIKDGNGTYRSVTDFMSSGNIKDSGQTFHDASYYNSGSSSSYYVIYRTPDMTNYFNYIWSDEHSIVGNYYRRANSTTTPDFARRGWAPTFDNGSSWTPSTTTSYIKYVSGTGLQYKEGSGSWTTLSNTINSPIVLIEAQGAGGGGGGACVNTGTASTHSYSGGGGGASGGYSAHVFDLSDGTQLTLVKGTGGTAGSNGYDTSGTAGSRGGNTYIQKNGTTIVKAPGGPGGNAATHKIGTTVAGGTSSGCALAEFTYMTSTSSNASTQYGNQFCHSLGGKGGKGAGPTESSKLSGTAGSTSSNLGDPLKRSGVGSAGGGGKGSNCTGLTKCSCGGGGGGSVLGNGGGGAKVYKSGSYWYHAMDGGGPGSGGGGGGGSYGWDGSSHRSGGPYVGGDGAIVVWYQTSYKHP